MEHINSYIIEVVGTLLLLLVAIEMFARVGINTWYEIKALVKQSKEK